VRSLGHADRGVMSYRQCVVPVPAVCRTQAQGLLDQGRHNSTPVAVQRARAPINLSERVGLGRSHCTMLTGEVQMHRRALRQGPRDLAAVHLDDVAVFVEDGEDDRAA
jgi:hypothetical protein